LFFNIFSRNSFCFLRFWTSTLRSLAIGHLTSDDSSVYGTRVLEIEVSRIKSLDLILVLAEIEEAKAVGQYETLCLVLYGTRPSDPSRNLSAVLTHVVVSGDALTSDDIGELVRQILLGDT